VNQKQMDRCERIERYLDGLLDEEDTRRFEQDLLDEKIAALFREVLLMRELLKELPPAEPPEGLVERIEAEMALPSAPQPLSGKHARENTGGPWSALKAGFRWPAYTLAGIPGGAEALKRSVGWMRALGYALGPFNTPLRKKQVDTYVQTTRPLWKVALNTVVKGVLS
jgi:anti-sigma factor RsiW